MHTHEFRHLRREHRTKCVDDAREFVAEWFRSVAEEEEDAHALVAVAGRPRDQLRVFKHRRLNAERLHELRRVGEAHDVVGLREPRANIVAQPLQERLCRSTRAVVMHVRAEPELRRLRAREEDSGVCRAGLRQHVLERGTQKILDVEFLRDQTAELTNRRRFIHAALHFFSRLREVGAERIHLTHEFTARFTELSADSLEARDALVATTLFTTEFECRGDTRTHVFVGSAEIDPVEHTSAHGAEEHSVTRRIASNHNLDRGRHAAHLRCEWCDVLE